ncbi:MAG: hypothetical protein ABIH64_02590 [Nanoarchaeota archaeon]
MVSFKNTLVGIVLAIVGFGLIAFCALWAAFGVGWVGGIGMIVSAAIFVYGIKLART